MIVLILLNVNLVGRLCVWSNNMLHEKFLYIFGKMDNLRFANPRHEKSHTFENGIVTKPHYPELSPRMRHANPE